MGGEQRIMGGDEDAPAGLRLVEQPLGKGGLALGVDPPRGLVEHEQIRLGDGDRGDAEPLPLAAREVARMTARREASSPNRARAAAARSSSPPTPSATSVERRLADEVAARILREVRRTSVPRRPSPARLEQPRSDLRERRLAAAVAPFERDDLAAVARQRAAAEELGPVAVGERDGVELQERRAAGRAARRRIVRLEPARVARPPTREPGARLGDRGVEDDPALLEHDHAIRDRERPVDALLGEDGGAPRRSTASRKAAAPAGIELRGRLVEEEQLRVERERRCEADPLQLAAGELDRASLGEVGGPDRSRAPPRRAARSAPARGPMFSSPNATSFSTRVITTWFSGSWKTQATVPASSAGPCVRVSSPPTSTRAREAAAVEVRDETGQRAQQRRLAAAGRPEQRDELALVELQRDPVEGPAAVGVGEREPFDLR